MVLDELPRKKVNPTLWWAIIATAMLLIIIIFSVGQVLEDSKIWIGVLGLILGMILGYLITPKERRLFDIGELVEFINEKENQTYKVHDFQFDEIGNGNFAFYLNKYGEHAMFRAKAQPEPNSNRWMFTYVGKTSDNFDELRERFETQQVYKDEAKTLQDINFNLEKRKRKEQEEEDMEE